MNNSLAEVHPELITEWSEKNLPLTPDDITFGSSKKVWWKGTCGHEWQTSVKACSNGEKCPICSGARVIAGINDLATLEPLLAKQWSKKNGGEWSGPPGGLCRCAAEGGVCSHRAGPEPEAHSGRHDGLG